MAPPARELGRRQTFFNLRGRAGGSARPVPPRGGPRARPAAVPEAPAFVWGRPPPPGPQPSARRDRAAVAAGPGPGTAWALGGRRPEPARDRWPGAAAYLAEPPVCSRRRPRSRRSASLLHARPGPAAERTARGTARALGPLGAARRPRTRRFLSLRRPRQAGPEGSAPL